MQAGRSRADHGATAGLKPRRPRRERWTRLASLAVLVAGMAGSALGASAWGSSVRNDGQRKFSAAADNVGSSLKTLLERDGDLVATARTLISTSPGVTDEQFRQWFATMGAARRYPGLFGFGGIASVPATDPGAASVLALDSSAGSVTFVPGQPRPAYCFITLVVMLDSGDTLAVPGSTVGRLLGLAPKNLDVCQGPLGAPLNDQQQTGQPGVISFASLLPGGVSLGVGGIGGVGAAGGVGGTGASSASSQADAAPAIFLSPVYRGVPSAAATPDTSGPFWGWVGAMFDVNTILRTARGGDGHTSVVLSRQQGAAAPVEVGRVGTAPRRGRLTRTVDIDADGRWIAQLSGSLATGGLSASAQSAAVLAAGFAVSVLLFSLIVVLGRSRERALVLVERKTGELQHQALHDALTGLPNRALVLDRAEQMLVRAQRELVPVAALFVDLDGFKDINDSFGHGAGDELLQLVATRLRTAVRAADTVGRLGGDEFVVLAEGASLAAGPELVAERVLEALKEPFRTDATGGNPLVVSASIGIAGGIRSSADELLRDADIAL
ncbi:MAG: diguanylate cyclase, partial [Acidimicrobiaceae bacterium]|nr:diguanylate cyclase [Acidimicrobiaceae bacterium]